MHKQQYENDSCNNDSDTSENIKYTGKRTINKSGKTSICTLTN